MGLSFNRNNITVCIIIPAFNSEKYIRECLDSLIKQTTRPDEIIVVDDGSTDNTSLIVREYEEKYSSINYIYQENQGQGKARNMALEISKSTHVMFLDSDDYIHEQTLARCIEWILKEDPDLVHFEHRKLYEDGRIIYPKENRFFDGISIASGEMCEEILNNSTYYTWNNLFNRNFLVENDIRYGSGVSVQDYVFLAKVGIHAKKICFIHAPLATYRVHSESVSHKYRDTRIQFESFLMGTKECLLAANETKASERATAFIINHKVYAFRHMYFEKTPSKYRKEFITCFYECFRSHEYQKLQYLSKEAKQYIGDGRALTRKKYNQLVRLVYFIQIKKQLRKYPRLVKTYLVFRKGIRGIKKALMTLIKYTKKSILFRYEKSCLKKPILDKTMALIGYGGLWRGNGKYLYSMLKKSFPEWKVFFLHNKGASLPNDVDAVCLNSLRGRSLVFRSKVLFIESWEKCPRRDDRVIIQLWHGTPIKKLLFDSTEPIIMKKSPNHRSSQYKQIQSWNYLVCDSRKAMDYFRSCFLIEDSKMLVCGYPRVKYLFDNLNNKELRLITRNLLDVKTNEKLILYFPTWRDYLLDKSNKDKSYLLNSSIFLEHLQGKAQYKLQTLEHSYGSNTIMKSRENLDTQDCILASDWIISDYSSVIFDAVSIGVPVALLIKDRENYEKVRGLYQDVLNDLTFCTAENEIGLAEILNNPPDAQKYQYIREKYCQKPEEFSLIEDLARILDNQIL